MSRLFARENITEASRFWEVGRLAYNLALVVVSGVVLLLKGFEWSDVPWIAPWLFLLGLIANVLYCVAYPVDLFVQASDFRVLWRKLRYGLWFLGTLIASLLAFMVLGGFWIFGYT